MNKENNIVYKKRAEIDIQKWDACIEAAPNGLIYAQSWWLDTMADNWDALILGDYEIVMPLTWKKKWGIKYLCQPAFTQQLGVISTNELTTEIIELFLAMAKKYFRFAEINLNFLNKIGGAESRNNFILDLNRTYEEIRSEYKKDLKKNLDKGIKLKLSYSTVGNIKEIICLYKKNYWSRNLGIKKKDLARLQQLMYTLQQKEILLIRTVHNQAGQLCTARLCPKYGKRIFFLLSVTPAGYRHHSSNHFLADQLIKEFSEQNILLDFEGSDLKGVANFYKNYCVDNQFYYFMKWSNLPWPVSVVKK